MFHSKDHILFVVQIAVTPIYLEFQTEPEIRASASDWLATVGKGVEGDIEGDA